MICESRTVCPLGLISLSLEILSDPGYLRAVQLNHVLCFSFTLHPSENPLTLVSAVRLVETVNVLLDHTVSPGDTVLRAVDAQGNTPLHVAAGQSIAPQPPGWTADALIREQDLMMRALLPPVQHGEVEGDTASGLSLMDQRNAEMKTPRELREERRRKWREDHEAELSRAAAHEVWVRAGCPRGGARGGGRGGGQGRGRGEGSVPMPPAPDPGSIW